jgi:hypothetical protein
VQLPQIGVAIDVLYLTNIVVGEDEAAQFVELLDGNDARDGPVSEVDLVDSTGLFLFGALEDSFPIHF